MKKKINFAFATSQQTFTQPCPSPACQCQAPWLNPFCIFSSWLHQECVAFQCSWPLSVDQCPWGIRQFKSSPLCISQKPRAVCISSGTSAWWVTSILIMDDTANATCCCAAKKTKRDFGGVRRWAAAHSLFPTMLWPGRSAPAKGAGKGHHLTLLWFCFQLPERRIWSRRAGGWARARHSWGSTSAASARAAGALGPSTHARFLLHDLALSLLPLPSPKFLLFFASQASLWKCLALEEVCATVSYRWLLGYIWAVKEVFCRDKVLASCQSKSGTLPGLCNIACGLWFPSIKPHNWHKKWCVLGRRWNTARWKAVLCPRFQACLLGLSRLCGMRFPRSLPSSAAKEPQPAKRMPKVLSVSAL